MSRSPLSATRPIAAALALLASCAALAPASARAQGVLVAPQSVVIDHRVRSGTFEVINPTGAPTEVAVSTVYGYPTTDSTGALVVRMVEAPDSTAPNAAAWVQAFPRRFILQPNSRQTVRLLVRPPATIADREYWSRIVVSAKGAAQIAARAADSTPLQAALSLEIRTIIALMYRKGALTTGLTLAEPRVTVSGDSARLRVRVTPQGNAAFLGTARIALRDASGRVLTTFDRRLAVYEAIEPAWTVPVATLGPGDYTLTLSITTARDDLPEAIVLKTPPVGEQVTFRLPARP